jgi:hypothetical protein
VARSGLQPLEEIGDAARRDINPDTCADNSLKSWVRPCVECNSPALRLSPPVSDDPAKVRMNVTPVRAHQRAADDAVCRLVADWPYACPRALDFPGRQTASVEMIDTGPVSPWLPVRNLRFRLRAAAVAA